MDLIYDINGAKIASKDYVDYIGKQIIDYLTAHSNSSDSHDLASRQRYKLDTSVSDASIAEIELGGAETTVSAKDIVTDANNAFISQAQLQALKEKPTMLEVKQMINSSKTDMSNAIKENMDTLMNTPDTMSKIKSLISILREDDTLTGLMNTLADKVNIGDFEAHKADDSYHIANNDRKALNALISLIGAGSFADWDAETGSLNCILNKPDTLPANGGNADTVGGHSADDLNGRVYDLIIGAAGYGYEAIETDYLLNEDYSNISEIAYVLENTVKGLVMIRPGIYIFDELAICNSRTKSSYDLIIHGAGNGTNIHKTNVTINQRVKLRDIYFDSSDVHIGSNCDVSDCEFSDCNVYFEGSVSSNIKNCYFKNCTFKYNANFTGNMVICNRYEGCTGTTFIGKNNIFRDNLTL